MRLLDVESFEFKEFSDDQRPPYVIASHRWLSDEVTLQQFREVWKVDKLKDSKKDKKRAEIKETQGYKKVDAFARYVREHTLGIKWLWIDTCCIDKTSAAELSEAINCMFEWYRQASICVVWMSDVGTIDALDEFDTSVWFTRGWTLQELLASRLLVFVTSSWQTLGHKGIARPDCIDLIGPDLAARISLVTGISDIVLQDYDGSGSLSAEDKMSWMNGRETTKPEDMVYALYGILGLTLGANYGEKYEGAMQRLRSALQERTEAFNRIKLWLSPPDPWTNHQAAKQLHEPGTGKWLLANERYLAWKQCATTCLWVHGKAGSGKTVLCSTVIEDMRAYCASPKAYGHAIFYFTFTDAAKQGYEDVLTSLVAQLCWLGPGLTMLQNAYYHPARIRPGRDELENMLLASFSSYREVFIQLDALDECPEFDRRRRTMLEGLGSLLRRARNVHVMATSRAELDIRFAMDELGARTISIEDLVVDSDIGQYVMKEMSRDIKLRRLDDLTKQLVRDTLVHKANGMFRWVYCQLVELSRSRHTGRRGVETALARLPLTLDATYERVLNSIDPVDQQRAFTYLRWIAYAFRPLTLSELCETAIITADDDSAIEDTVDEEDRGDPWDSLALLMGLIVEDTDARPPYEDNSRTGNSGGSRRGEDDGEGGTPQSATKQRAQASRLRLAHFSVKEYLESKRILTTPGRVYALNPARDHRFITQSSLVYLAHLFAKPHQPPIATADSKRAVHWLDRYPLKTYSAQRWLEHARLQDWRGNLRELALLGSEDQRSRWIQHSSESGSYIKRGDTVLHYAIVFRLHPLVGGLLERNVDVDEFTPSFGTALQAAAYLGDKSAAESLLRHGANPNGTQDENYSSPMHYAAGAGHWDILLILLAAGADPQARHGGEQPLLHLAAKHGDAVIVDALLAKGAGVNERWVGHARCGNAATTGLDALEIASMSGHVGAVSAVLRAGADPNRLQDDTTALESASAAGYDKVVAELLQMGVNPNMTGRRKSALEQACENGHHTIVTALLEGGADPNGPPRPKTALELASESGHDRVVSALLQRGADPNTFGRYHSVLELASERGHAKVVAALLQAGPDLNKSSTWMTALERASGRGHVEVVILLLQAGANPNRSSMWTTALERASANGHVEIVKALEQAGADPPVRGHEIRHALMLAYEARRKELAVALPQAGADRLEIPDIDDVLARRSDPARIALIVDDHEREDTCNVNSLKGARRAGHLGISQLRLCADAVAMGQGKLIRNNALAHATDRARIKVSEACHPACTNGDATAVLGAACREGHIEVVQTLLRAGTDVNARGDNGANALEMASNAGHANVVVALLKVGADVNRRSGSCVNALELASAGARLEVVEALLRAGANADDRRSSSGLSALEEASLMGNVEIVDALIRGGADINARIGHYETALELGSLAGRVEVVNALLRAGANANARAGNARNALELASGMGHVDVVAALLRGGANVNDWADDPQRANALEMASGKGHFEVVEMLLHMGAYVKRPNEYYTSALERAAIEGRMEVVNAILRGGADVGLVYDTDAREALHGWLRDGRLIASPRWPGIETPRDHYGMIEFGAVRLLCTDQFGPWGILESSGNSSPASDD